MADRLAFDIIAQATGGIMHACKQEDRPPKVYWADLVSGAYCALGILQALLQRERTGQGQLVDISMQDVLYFNNYRAMVDRAMDPIVEQVEQLLGRKPKDVLNSADRMPFYGFFRSKDGKVAIVALTPRQWKDLSETVGRPELVTDARFSNLIGQIHNHAAAVALIEEWTSQHTSEEIISALESRRIPCGTAYSSEQVNRDENLGKRRMFAKVHHEVLGDIDVPGIPFQFSETQGTVRLPAPGLGEHNRLILGQWLGLSEEEIEGLYRLKVLV